MTPRTLARLLGGYALAVILCCGLVVRLVALGPGQREVVASAWRSGQLVERAVLGAADAELPATLALAETAGAEIVREQVEDEGPILIWPELALSFSLVPGRDGLKATANGRTVYLTPDDLLSLQVYDRGISFEGASLTVGADVPRLVALLAERLAVPARAVLDVARIRRIRVKRPLPAQPAPRAETLTAEDVRSAAVDAARFLARGVNDEGRFRYMIDAPTNRTMSGYDWPRHAGATYFLAQAAALTRDPDLTYATLRAASLLREKGLARCGDDACVAEDNVAEIGSSALAIIAFSELVRTGLDTSYRAAVVELTRFLVAQQRPDGELMHQYDRRERRRIDVQFLYFTGEAALGLARAHATTGDVAARDASARALAHLVGPGWRFFGDRYYFGEEHWTCQAMAELWTVAPDRAALGFCLRWMAFNRRLQHVQGDSPLDAEGAFSIDPVLTPRLTPVGSRGEAGVATLDAARRAGLGGPEVEALDLELRRALALLIRKQFRPGPRHLFADPAAVHGAMPGSEVDWQLRIDYAQHAGSSMIRWLEVVGAH